MTARASSALAHSKCLSFKFDRFLCQDEISSPPSIFSCCSRPILLPAAIIVDEADIGRYTVKAALDPRTANKIVRLEPPRNVLTQNELVALAEKVWGKTIKKKHVSAEALVEAYKSEFHSPRELLVRTLLCASCESAESLCINRGPNAADRLLFSFCGPRDSVPAEDRLFRYTSKVASVWMMRWNGRTSHC